MRVSIVLLAGLLLAGLVGCDSNGVTTPGPNPDSLDSAAVAKAVGVTALKARIKAAKAEMVKAATRSAAATAVASAAVEEAEAATKAVSRVEANPKVDHARIR